MSITIDLGGGVEAKLREQAAARGMPVKEYVEGLVRGAAEGAPQPPESGSSPTLAEFEADWAAFGEGLDHIPPTPEALTREAL